MIYGIDIQGNIYAAIKGNELFDNQTVNSGCLWEGNTDFELCHFWIFYNKQKKKNLNWRKMPKWLFPVMF